MTPTPVFQSRDALLHVLHIHATQAVRMCVTAAVALSTAAAAVALPRMALPWVVAAICRDLAD